MRSEGYSSWSVCLSVCLFVCLSVCLSVDDYSRTTGYEAAYERYQQLQSGVLKIKICGAVNSAPKWKSVPADDRSAI